MAISIKRQMKDTRKEIAAFQDIVDNARDDRDKKYWKKMIRNKRFQLRKLTRAEANAGN